MVQESEDIMNCFAIVNQIIMQGNKQYLQCPIHSSEFIQLICLTCSSNSLACPLCLDISHNLHQVISLKKFMAQEVPKLYTERPNPEHLGKSLDSLSGIFKQYIDKMRKEIGHEINQLELFFLERDDRLKQELLFVCGQHKVKNLHQNVEAAKLMLKNKQHIPPQDAIGLKLKQIETKMGQSINDACIEIRRIVFKLKNLHNESCNVLLNSKSISNFQFSRTLSHGSIELKSKNTLAINKHFDNLYHSCAIVPPLCPFHNEITLEIKKSDHKCVWLGVADLEVLTKMNYENTYKGDGHGYWIWQAGGDDEAEIYAENSRDRPLAGWNFDAGDRVTLRILYSEDGKKTLEIIKNGDEQTKYSMPIQSRIGTYYACISLGDQEQSISIAPQF